MAIQGISMLPCSLRLCTIVWLCGVCHGLWLHVYPSGELRDKIFLSGGGCKSLGRLREGFRVNSDFAWIELGESGPSYCGSSIVYHMC